MRLRRNLVHAPEELHVLENATQELRVSIQHLLEFAQVEARNLRFSPQQVDLNRIIEESRHRFVGMALTRGVEIHCQLEPLFPLSGDPELLRKVLSNLIDNGLKYSPRGGKLFLRSWEVGEVLPFLDSQKRWAAVSVEDEGTGIPSDKLPGLFSAPASWTDASQQNPLYLPRPGYGSSGGIGLYLCKVFLDLHGGTIRYDNPPPTPKNLEPKGGVFTFYLPF